MKLVLSKDEACAWRIAHAEEATPEAPPATAPAESTEREQQLLTPLHMMVPPPAVDARLAPPLWAEPRDEPNAGSAEQSASMKAGAAANGEQAGYFANGEIVTPHSQSSVANGAVSNPASRSSASNAVSPVGRPAPGPGSSPPAQQPQEAVRARASAAAPPSAPPLTQARAPRLSDSSRASRGARTGQMRGSASSASPRGTARSPTGAARATAGRGAANARAPTARSPGASGRLSRGTLDTGSRMSTGPSARNAETEKVKELIRGVYQRKKPSKLGELDALFEKHRGHEKGIYEHVCRKYGETPISLSGRAQ